MRDAYQNFQELKAQEEEGEAWTREYISRGSNILVMAPHGGWIEPFTAELAGAVAGNDLSFYAFPGLKPRGNDRLHLTSHRFDEPLALEAASAALWVLAIHGERDSSREFVMVGGLWGEFRERMVEGLKNAGIDVVEPREGLGGVNPRNICNLGSSRVGGQLELSEGLRQSLRRSPTQLFSFAGLVRSVLIETESELLAGGGSVTFGPAERAGVTGFLREQNGALPALVKREVKNKLQSGKKNPNR
ncbi:MAG: poly-gamma-glutamate hydrolase family protein [Gemmatimonadetes bacterium]|nr:poly-gamma-glutamate hydrolase family protein [Gemmatimonadota bacterium]